MITGKPEHILNKFIQQHPEIPAVDRLARANLKVNRRAVYPYQAAALYHYAKPYNGGRMLEIGTAYGYSCFYLASAAPDSPIVTLNPSHAEAESARRSLKQFPNVQVVEYLSWDYFSVTGKFNREYDFIFVDGDHNRIKRDLPWFNRVKPGGLIMFHDYSPADSGRACPPVYQAVNEMAERLGREPDVLVVDNDKVGLAGFYRLKGEVING